MNVDLICVGKVKEKYFNEAASEYEKRLSRFCKLNVITVPDVSTNDSIESIQKKEMENILKKLDTSSCIIIFDIDGKVVSSPDMAEMIDKIFTYEKSKITFIIGGSHGLHPDLKAKANRKISFGKVTYPHKLFKVIALEQIYRSYKINNGGEYHK
jgi:23S rRNA (pseudouridine1915-N3)-methyltransferase